MSDAYLIRCPACTTKNRIPRQKAGESAKCGKCGGAVPTEALLTDHPLEVSDRDFDPIVLGSPLPVLLDCWAAWCGPCQMIGPIMDQLAAEWQGHVRIAKLNVDENQQTAAKFQIMTIPTLLIFDRGKLMDRLTGAFPKQGIVQKMRPYLF